MLLTRLKDPALRLAYAQRAVQYGWSRNVLNIHIETQSIERECKTVTIGLLLCKSRAAW